MRPHPRMRKTVKWGGAVVTAMLGICVAYSFLGSCTMASGSSFPAPWKQNEQPDTIAFEEFSMQRGRVVWTHGHCRRPGLRKITDEYFEKPWTVEEGHAYMLALEKWAGLHNRYVQLWKASETQLENTSAAFHRFYGVGWIVALPAWSTRSALGVAFLASLLSTRWAWRTIGPGLCPKCHYDRTGLAAGAVCPECGAASPA